MGLYTWHNTLKGGFGGFDPRGIYTHFAHYILIEQVQAAATIHEDSRKVESINNWVKDQCD